MEPIDLRSIIEYAVKTCREGVSDKELVWMCNLPERPLPVRADSGRITQVLWNLLKNAAKFTPDHGSITIAGTLEEGDRQPTVIVQVTDNGIGIEPDLLPRIFGAFEQGDRTITRRFGGLGLGLAISKAIVELHRGTLVAESAGPGQGAIFTLRLPMSSQTIAAPLPKDTPGPREVSRPSLPSAHILLVEDHADTAAIMTRMLRHAGFDVTAACGVQDALCKIEQAGANGSDREHPRPVQLVVSDLGLPDGSGIEMMTTLREKYLVPGIALSGFGMEDDIRRSEAAGFAKHLTKPVDFERLVEAIRQVLA
jgi:CheY-like chemotaxis protein